MKYSDLLNAQDFSDVLNKEEQELVLSNLKYIIINKGECFVKQGSSITDAIYIKNGYIKIHLELNRRDIIFDILGPNRFVILGTMICSEVHPYNITAVDEVSVCMIPIDIIRELARNNTKLANRLVEIMNNRIKGYIKNHLISLTQNNIHGKLANTLIYLSETVFGSRSFDMILSRKELAQLSNISRENVIKILYEFKSDGIIRLNGRKIEILFPDSLRRIANHG